MNEMEIIEQIAKQKIQKAKDLMLHKEIQCLFYQGANANCWFYQINGHEDKEWSDKLQEFLSYQSIRGYEEGWSNEKLDCLELIFPTYTFTFKFTSDFRRINQDNNTSYGNLYVLYNNKEVISFTLIGCLNMIDKVISIDSFIEGEWIADFKQLMMNVRLFVVWENNNNEHEMLRSEAHELEKEALELRKKFGITEEDIMETRKRSYEPGFTFAKLVRKYPAITVIGRGVMGIISIIILLLIIGLISGDF